MTFTEKAVSDAIALTGDASRVINGMPFYTRAWITTPATDGKKGEGVYVEMQLMAITTFQVRQLQWKS